MSDFDVNNLVRENIRKLIPYKSARGEFDGEASVLLDANENPFVEKYNRYPDPMQVKLKRAIGDLKKFPANQIFLGNGSDEGIDLAIRIFCEPGRDNIVVTPPTFSWFSVAANISNVEVREAMLDTDFQLQPDKITAEIDNNSKILFLCSPNNPTGNLLDEKTIEQLIKFFPGIVMVDEAYQDFNTTTSWIDRIAEFPNLIVTQTFSKAWGHAGIRLGMVFGSPEIINHFNRVKSPYNVNIHTQELALQLLNDNQSKEQQVQQIITERRRLVKELATCSMVQHIYPSHTNFLLVKFRDSQLVYDTLMSQGIIVRDRSREPLCENCLRITVGTPAENTALLTEIAAL